MTTKNRKRSQMEPLVLYSRLLLPALVMALAGAQNAAASIVDFESFTLGASVNGQSQWTVEDSFGNSGELFDEQVVNDGGNKVWRISNAFTSGSYSNQPFSNRPAQVAGETGAGLYNDYGTNNTMPNNPPLSSATAASPYFYGAFDFKSATGAGQSGINMVISAGASQSPLRQSYIRIDDSGSGGFDLNFFDTTGSAFNGPTTIDSGLAYDEWHKIEMFIEFVDGIGPGAAGSEAGNDILNIFHDGTLIQTGTTWESFYYNNSISGVPAPSARAVDSLLFRQSGNTMSNQGGGLYFDNVEVSNARLGGDVPEPASLALFGLGLAGLGFVRRRKA